MKPSLNNKLLISLGFLLIGLSNQAQSPYSKTSDNNGYLMISQKSEDRRNALSYNFEDSRLGFMWSKQGFLNAANNSSLYTPNNTILHSVNVGFSFTEGENFFSAAKSGFDQGLDLGYTGACRYWLKVEDADKRYKSFILNWQVFNNASTFNSAGYSTKFDTTKKANDTIIALKKAQIANDLGGRIGLSYSIDHAGKGNMTIVGVSGLLGYYYNFHDRYDEYQHISSQLSYKDKDENRQSLQTQSKYVFGNPVNQFYRGFRLDLSQRLFTFRDKNDNRGYLSNYMSLLLGATAKYYENDDPVVDVWIGPTLFKSYNKPVVGIMLKLSDILSTQKDKVFSDIYSFNIFFGVPFGAFKA